ncbi:hypothetical protein GCM10010232_46660 [Streptomyces amakusaensis]|uniref:ATP-binding protein n=1 Tax=Streptomyces amakusaensis TaxID=67271 RepID=A0ABW0AHP0_9ACTN
MPGPFNSPTHRPTSANGSTPPPGLDPDTARIQRIKLSFPPEAEWVVRIRHLSGAILYRNGLTDPDLLHTTELLVSEIVTNAITHGGGEEVSFTLECDPRREIRIEVDDHGSGVPRIRHPSHDDESGRGMLLVDLLAQTWGRKGSCTWCTVPTQEVVA